MSAMSDYLEVELRKHVFRTGTYTKPTVLGFSFCTASPTDAGTGASQSEVPNAAAYARIDRPPLDANWTGASAVDGLTDNAAAITFVAATGAWGTCTHTAINDSITYGAGNMLLHGALGTSKVVGNGDVIAFALGAFDITFA